MRTLEVLLKRAGRHLEDVSRELKAADARWNDVLTRRAACQASTEAEAAMVDGSPLSGFGFAAFLDLQKKKLAELDVELEAAEEYRETCKTALAAAYAESKKLEGLLARKQNQQRLEQEKSEQEAFDERSSQMFGRG